MRALSTRLPWLFFAACLLSGCPRSGASKNTPADSNDHVPNEGGAGALEGREAHAGPCIGVPCERFASPAAAFDRVLEGRPRVLAVGESHAPADGPRVPSATVRFKELLLPRLSGRATDLVLELWIANGKCGKSEVAVREKQAPIVAREAKTNPNEFVALGDAAFGLGIKPHVLVPTCEEYARILDAGAGDVDLMLTTIAKRSIDVAFKFLPAELTDAATGPSTLLMYGGSVHNDLHPRPGREPWSFGPTIAAKVPGRYVELDLVVPEFIKDDEVWKNLPWFPHFDRAKHTDVETVLMHPKDGVYVLVFPFAPR